jgi:hypothetical protein
MGTEAGLPREEGAWLLDELRALRQQIVGLEERVARLELAQEIWREPDAAGDAEPHP